MKITVSATSSWTIKSIFSGLVLILSGTQSQALSCFQPSSGEVLSLQKTETEIHLRYSHGRGYDFIRQFEGPVSANDLPLVRFQTQSLKELDSGFEVSIPLVHCDFSKTQSSVFLCSTEVKVRQAQALTVSSLSGYTVTQEHLSGEFKIQNFRMMVGAENVFFFVMSFPSQNCTGTL